LSVELATVCAIVEEGPTSLRKMFQAGVNEDDFPTCDEEIAWVIQRAEEKLPINSRIFLRKFKDFPWTPTDERLQDLLVELKSETAFSKLSTLIETTVEDMDVENAVEKADFLKGAISEVTREFQPQSDFLGIGDWQKHIDEQRLLRALRKQGVPPGIPTGLKHLDVHWDGLVNGRMIVLLGRPGEGKSFLLAKFVWQAVKEKYRVLLFSPEMSVREHLCRIHTLASADADIKQALGLEYSFRNRALMSGIGYNIKRYSEFCRYLAEEDKFGEFRILSGRHRRQKMTVGFIDGKIQSSAPDLVIIDPIYKLKSSRHFDSPIMELAHISDEIEDLCERYDIPIIITNQAHRQGSERDDAPHKDKSFNSDVPIQEADHVIGVKNMSNEHRMILRCSKSRFGSSQFRFELKFYPNTGVMEEVEEPDVNYYNGKDDPEEAELKEMVNQAIKPTRKEPVDA
jgi:archaellum biogenesis ATPase FlaH